MSDEKPLSDPWPKPKITPEQIRKLFEEATRRGDLRDKLADLSFLREPSLDDPDKKEK